MWLKPTCSFIQKSIETLCIVYRVYTKREEFVLCIMECLLSYHKHPLRQQFVFTWFNLCFAVFYQTIHFIFFVHPIISLIVRECKEGGYKNLSNGPKHQINSLKLLLWFVCWLCGGYYVDNTNWKIEGWKEEIDDKLWSSIFYDLL